MTHTGARTLALCAAIFLAGSASAQERFAGDEALSLAQREWSSATLGLAEQRSQAVLRHLKADAAQLRRHRPSPSAKLIKAEGALELDELSNAVVIARQSVKINTANNVLIIADSGVQVAFATAVMVVASGPIRIAHEMDTAGGVYATRSTLAISGPRNAVAYAMGGAEYPKYSQGTVRLYNTEPKDSNIPLAIELPGRLFAAEPARKPRAPSIVAINGQAIRFGGTRCQYGMRIELLDSWLTAAVKEPACGYFESATVRCTRDEGGTGAGLSLENWTLRGCGKSMLVVARTNPFTTAADLDRASAGLDSGAVKPPPVLTSQKLTSEEMKQIGRLFDEAGRHSARFELVPARAKYAQVLVIAPDYQPALANIASVDSMIARADAAAAPFTDKINNGRFDGYIYMQRGLAYINAGDIGRGLADFDIAADRNPLDQDILLQQAGAYMRVGRTAECLPLAGALIRDYPGLAKAYEIRAWCNLMENHGAAAAQDARASLELGAPWTAESFAKEKAGYRVIVGYFGLRQTAPEETARAWLKEWRAPLASAAWPDAFVAYLAGEIDHDTMQKVAASLHREDRGNAMGEAAVFAAQETHFRYGSDADSRGKATAIFRQQYSAGITLGYTLARTLTVPGRLIKRREELDAPTSVAR